MWSVFSDRRPVARKQHKCEECRTTIQPGERYYAWGGLWEGEWQHGKCCLPCNEAAVWYIEHGYGSEGWVIGELDENLVEEGRASKSFAAYRFVVGIRKRRREARATTVC